MDQTPNQVVYGKSDLPNYLFLSRMIETITAIDENTVCTSGYEQFREADNNSKDTKRNFFHTWTRQGLVWKMTTKR